MNDDTFWFGELLRFMNLNQYSQSAAQPGISIDVIENLKIPVPPVTEQIRIAEYIKHESNSLNALREEVSKTTILLKERRAALITAAVTGQIPVEEMNP
jgi:type I restriction enzyme S subunit